MVASLWLAWGVLGCVRHAEPVDTSPTCPGPPTVTDEAPVTSAMSGTEVTMTASANDDACGASGIIVVDLFYQQGTSNTWKKRGMLSVDGGLWQGSIPGPDVGSESMRYYLEALDQLDETACAPTACDQDPSTFTVSP